MNEFTKIEGYQDNTQKSIVLLPTSSKQSKNQTLKIQFLIASKKIHRN